MTARVEFDLTADGMRITRLSTVDRVLEVPAEVSGVPVTSLAPSFLKGCPGSGGRTLRIPGSVVSVPSDALDGSGGIVRIEYGGDLETFCGFKLVNSSDCTLCCRHDGGRFEFDFIRDTPMSFPEFDEAILSLHMRLTPEIAVRRLNDPVMLTERDAELYRRFVSDRIVPRAEQAVTSGETDVLTGLLGTGMVSDDVLRRLLERSVRAGRVEMTSLIMTEARHRHSDGGRGPGEGC